MKKFTVCYTIMRVVEIEAENEATALSRSGPAIVRDLYDHDLARVAETASLEVLYAEDIP
jgi:hypothetical protein